MNAINAGAHAPGPKVSAIIVNWNVANLLDLCLASLLRNAADVSWEAVIVDNNSSGTSFRDVRNKYAGFPQFRWIENKENIGNVAANQGWRISRGQYLLELGPDAAVLPGAVANMAEFLDGHPEAGAVAARFLNPDGTPQNYYYRHWNLIMCFLTTGLGKLIDKKIFCHAKEIKYFGYDLDTRKIITVEQPAGACLLVRREALAPGDLVDRRFPFYFDDADQCQRIADKGYKIYILPSAEIIHDQCASFNKTNNDWREREFRRSAVRYFQKFHPGQVVFLKILFLLTSATKSLYDTVLSPGRRNR
jgi:GT2 family glycosyltransferase